MYELRQIAFIVFIFLLVDSNTGQLTMNTPNINATLGSNVTIVAASATYINTTQVNWYALSTSITSNGVLTASPTKYSVINNGTYFALTIYSLSASDFGLYTLLYLNLPSTIISLNATILQYTTTTSRSTKFFLILKNF